MKRETLYASLAGCAAFFLIAYGSYWCFSPAERITDSAPTAESAAGKDVGATSVAGNEPVPFPEKPAAPDNASPAGPLRPTPTAYGAIVDTGRSPVEMNPPEDEEGRRILKAREKTDRMGKERKGIQREKRRKRDLAEED